MGSTPIGAGSIQSLRAQLQHTKDQSRQLTVGHVVRWTASAQQLSKRVEWKKVAEVRSQTTSKVEVKVKWGHAS
jgi:hypothetical protein